MEYEATHSTGSLSSSSTSTSSSKPPLDPTPLNSATPDLLFPSTQIPTIALSIPTPSAPYSLSRSPTIVNIGSSSKPLPPKRALSLSSVSTPSQPFFSTLRTTIHQPNSPGLDERGFPGLNDRSGVEEDRGAVSRYGASGPRGRRLNGVYTPVSAEAGTSAGALQPGARNDTANQLEAKVVILGSQGVGKTSIVHRYTSGHFSYSLSSTIGASFLTKKLVVEDCKVRLQIWDTAGQERFRSMAPLYYRGALAAILVYDITNADSFNDVKIWLEELRRNMSPDLIIHVVGSKGDLAHAKRAVDLTTARRTIANWVYEAKLAANPITSTSSRSPSPPSTSSNIPAPPNRPRSRTLSTQRVTTMSGSTPAITPLVSTTTTNSRVRTKLASTTGMPYSASTSAIHQQSIDFPPPSTEMTRSSSKLSLSLGGLGIGSGSGSGSSGRSRRGTDEGRKSWEDAEKAREKERGEERERELVERRISESGIVVSEVSAKDDDGIEELFLHITRRLVERKAKIENDRVLRSRDSIMLHDAVASPPTPQSSWCC